MSKNIQMIALDLDGTALMRDHLQEAPGIVEALDRSWQKGIRIIPVTGRPWGMLPPMFREKRDWYSYGIFCNGAQLRDLRTGEILQARPVTTEILDLLAEISVQYGIAVEFCSGGKMYLTRNSWEQEKQNEKLFFHCTQVLETRGVTVDSLKELRDRSVEKVNLNGVPEKLRNIVNEIFREHGLCCAWSGENGELTHPEATKGKMLETLCRMVEIPMSSVMALGDSENDLSMLKAAGLGVAMGNAKDAVRQAADAVTLTNEQGGAAEAIRKYILDE